MEHKIYIPFSKVNFRVDNRSELFKKIYFWIKIYLINSAVYQLLVVFHLKFKNWYNYR